MNKEQLKMVYGQLGIKTYNNEHCKNCNDCCGVVTVVTVPEFQNLMNYFTTPGKGRLIYNKAMGRWNKQLSIEYARKTCPFSDENKRCEIYAFRPNICREFHCNPDFVKERSSVHKEYFDQGFYDMSDFFKPLDQVKPMHIKIK